MNISAKLDKDLAARQLAEAHFRVDPSIKRVFRLVHPDPDQERQIDEPIKLLEVNDETVIAGIQPVYFGPDDAHGLLFPSIIIEIHSTERDALNRGDLVLPDGWRVDEEYARPEGA